MSTSSKGNRRNAERCYVVMSQGREHAATFEMHTAAVRHEPVFNSVTQNGTSALKG